MMINENEINIARHCISYAVKHGADAARVSMNKSVMDGYNLLNGELDKVTHSADRSIYLYIFADGRYGTFSTNRLEKDELESFILKAIEMVRMLGEDECRCLPDPARTEPAAKTGRELDLYDEEYERSDAEKRLAKAHSISLYGKTEACDGYEIISEECEYSESEDDNYLIDSQGFEGRHTETMYYCFAEVTIKAADGCKYSGYWWEAAQKEADLDCRQCARKALDKAVRQIGPRKRRSGNYRMVVDNSVASRLLSPIISALNASAIQQKMSFLDGSLDRKIFPEGMTLMDMARTPGKSGSRLFDTEGVATKDCPIIENGRICQYFVSTYMSKKMDIPPTVEDLSRPVLKPYLRDEDLSSEEKGVSLQPLLRRCGNGILVTGFNGGNCNPVTGDFSFGIEGFAFSRGKITHPVREMLITGNIIDLWNNLIAAGDDYRPSARWQIGTLAFENVSFSA
jgi:PmbA protein